MVEKSYRAYVTDSLRLIMENTAMPAAWLTQGEGGKMVESRWLDAVSGAQRPAEKRTAEEIIAEIRERLTSM